MTKHASEVMPTVGQKDFREGWSEAVLKKLDRPDVARVVGTFLEGALGGIERVKLDALIPSSAGEQDFLALCRSAGCDQATLDRLGRLDVRLPEPRPRPRAQRCCFLRHGPEAPRHIALSQYELYAKSYGLRFARPGEMLALAAAAPDLDFGTCHAIGAVMEGHQADAWTLHSGVGSRFVLETRLLMAWDRSLQILAVKVD